MKVGDRVRVVKDTMFGDASYFVGKIGAVIDVFAFNTCTVAIDGDDDFPSYLFYANEIEVIDDDDETEV